MALNNTNAKPRGISQATRQKIAELKAKNTVQQVPTKTGLAAFISNLFKKQTDTILEATKTAKTDAAKKEALEKSFSEQMLPAINQSIAEVQAKQKLARDQKQIAANKERLNAIKNRGKEDPNLLELAKKHNLIDANDKKAEERLKWNLRNNPAAYKEAILKAVEEQKPKSEVSFHNKKDEIENLAEELYARMDDGRLNASLSVTPVF